MYTRSVFKHAFMMTQAGKHPVKLASERTFVFRLSLANGNHDPTHSFLCEVHQGSFAGLRMPTVPFRLLVSTSAWHRLGRTGGTTILVEPAVVDSHIVNLKNTLECPIANNLAKFLTTATRQNP